MLLKFGDILPETSKSSACWDMGGNSHLRDWSITTGWGGGKLEREGGACEVLPLRKEGGGAETVLAMLKGGHKRFWGSFYAVA